MKMPEKKELEVKGQHDAIKVAQVDGSAGLSNPDPAAAWFPKAGLGLFIHWGLSAVRATLDLSWGMICGWEFASREATDYEISEMKKPLSERTIGKHFTPNMYFALEKDFKGEKFSADTLVKRAKDAGFKYAVFTTRHHDGFALWPSDHGNFNTKNYLGGRDFVREFSDACEKYGMKKGLYYSPPDWYFNREYMSYIVPTARKRNPALPELDADYNPTVLPSESVKSEHDKLYGAYVAGQIEELLKNYGKVDLLWFDGTMPEGQVYPMEKIRAYQPGIVVNPRLHGTGDFETKEVKEADSRPAKWWEFCTQWPSRGWAYMKDVPYRPLSDISAEYARTIAWGGNYLLDVGPTADGTLPAEAEEKLDEFKAWREKNKEGLEGISPIADGIKCNYPASEKDGKYYIYIIYNTDGDIVLTGINGEYSASVLDSGKTFAVSSESGKLTVKRPANNADNSVRIVVLKKKT